MVDIFAAERTLIRFNAMGKHIRKKVRKFQRRAGPLIRRIDRVIAEMEARAALDSQQEQG